MVRHTGDPTSVPYDSQVVLDPWWFALPYPGSLIGLSMGDHVQSRKATDTVGMVSWRLKWCLWLFSC